MSENIQANLSGLQRENFQKEVQGKKTDLFFLRNKKGFEVAITNYGGAMVAIMVPDREGKVANVIMGHDNIEDVINKPEPFLSTLIGRYGNRISKGKFVLDGKEYTLALNDGANALHGGPTGFHARVWDAKQIDDQTVELHYTAADMEEGFPGQLDVTVTYTFNDDNALVIDYKATTDKKTVVNLTSHGYFALAGIADPTPVIDDIICTINADYYIPVDSGTIPLGTIESVEGTPFDFRTPKVISKDIDADDVQIKNGTGYDHCYVLNKKEEGELSFAAKIVEPHSGRTMEVYTTEPGVQFYTDNWGSGQKGTHGATYPKRSAVCFEAQHFPDTPNRPYFPSVELCPGQVYTQKTIYKFGTDKQ
jgi:aldose 1-epimerase